MRTVAVLTVLLTSLAFAADEKAPATSRAARGDLRVEAESTGRIEPFAETSIVLKPQAYAGRHVLVEVLEPGTVVAPGDIVMRFETREIDEAIDEARFELGNARQGLDALVERQTLAQQGAAEALERKERELYLAEKAWRDWTENAKPHSHVRARMDMESTEFGVQNAKDELDQLEKMYAEDEIVDETENIVIKRARFEYDRRVRDFELRKQQRAWFLENDEPEQDRNYALAVRQKKAELDRLRVDQRLEADGRAMDLEKTRRRFARQERDFARLSADRDAMTVRAPAAGVFLHGAIEGSLDRAFAPGTVVAAGGPVATVADPGQLVVAVSLPVREALRLRVGLTARIVPEAAGAAETTGTVAFRPILPRGGNLPVRVVPAAPLPRGLLGVPAKVRILLEEVAGALLVENGALRSEGGKTYCVVRRAPDRDEKVEVTIGATDGKRTVVLTGLAEGDEVVLGGARE